MSDNLLSVELDRATLEELAVRGMANAVMYEKRLAEEPLLKVTREVYEDSAVFWRLVVSACRQTLGRDVKVPV